jgi:hypothetical protein
MLEATKQIVAVKNIEMPDERHAFEHASLNVVNLPGVTIARTVYQPGWKWSTDVKPVVGTEACQAAHTGYIISGRLHARCTPRSKVAVPGICWGPVLSTGRLKG